MSNHFRKARLFSDGMIYDSSFPRPDTGIRNLEGVSLRIEEPMRFHWARYEHLTRAMHGKTNLAAAGLSVLILLMLGWKANTGELISPERWLCGAGAGWFVIWMARLALFTFFAAPRFISLQNGQVQISGLGVVKLDQIRQWSLDRGVLISGCDRQGARLQLCCRWFWRDRRWSMFLDDGPETDLLQRWLEAQLPRVMDAAERSMSCAIGIEAGILSH